MAKPFVYKFYFPLMFFPVLMSKIRKVPTKVLYNTRMSMNNKNMARQARLAKKTLQKLEIFLISFSN